MRNLPVGTFYQSAQGAKTQRWWGRCAWLGMLLWIGVGLTACSDRDANPAKTGLPTIPLRINELKLSPIGSEYVFEFLELHGTPGMLLTDMYVLVINGHADTNPGTVLALHDLHPIALGQNGLLLIHPPTTQVTNMLGKTAQLAAFPTGFYQRSTSDQTLTVLLVQSPIGFRLGDDLDIQDDGTLDGLPPEATLVDSIGWHRHEADLVYSTAVITDPFEAATRWAQRRDPHTLDAWSWGVRLSEAPRVQTGIWRYDLDLSNSYLPPNAHLTPGAPNFGEVPFVLLNELWANPPTQAVALQYIELAGVPRTNLQDVYIVVMDAVKTHPGDADRYTDDNQSPPSLLPILDPLLGKRGGHPVPRPKTVSDKRAVLEGSPAVLDPLATLLSQRSDVRGKGKNRVPTRGNLVYVKQLADYELGENGLLVVKNAAVNDQIPSQTTLVDEPLFSGTGILNHDALTIALLYSPYRVFRVGDTLDTNQDGQLDAMEGVYVVDMISWSGVGKATVGTTTLVQAGGTPAAATRLRRNYNTTSRAWIHGDVFFNSQQWQYDPRNASTPLPEGAFITPGALNVFSPPSDVQATTSNMSEVLKHIDNNIAPAR